MSDPCLCHARTGGVLQTLVLRPPLLYGEGDRSFVPVIVRLARAGGDRVPSVGDPEAFIQAAYVGKTSFTTTSSCSCMVDC